MNKLSLIIKFKCTQGLLVYYFYLSAYNSLLLTIIVIVHVEVHLHHKHSKLIIYHINSMFNIIFFVGHVKWLLLFWSFCNLSTTLNLMVIYFIFLSFKHQHFGYYYFRKMRSCKMTITNINLSIYFFDFSIIMKIHKYVGKISHKFVVSFFREISEFFL